ncbi:hypothetical protein ACO229_08790 [Promicromonospora sp. MS192]|uniref:hypothetical protein n=1 Tax=Promicromonospora sp. MS192 TaxID=3412684 RepID=UPI003C2E6674
MTGAPWNPRRIVVPTVLVALGAGGLAWWSVIDLWHAAAATALACAVSIVWAATETTVADPEWPRTAVDARPGGRHDVSDLGWSVFGRDGLVTDRVVRRIRALAVDRLRAHGVDAEDPATRPEVERLLGTTVVRQLASGMPPRARTVQGWLDAIERLGPAPDPARRTASPDAPTDTDPEEHRA